METGNPILTNQTQAPGVADAAQPDSVLELMENPSHEAEAETDAPGGEDFPLYPLDESTIECAVKSGIVRNANGSVGQKIAVLTIRRPSEKELIEREKKNTTAGRLITKDVIEIDAGDSSEELALASKIALAIRDFDMKDGKPREETRNLNAANVSKIPASMRLAALRGLYASTCSIDALDLESGVAIVRQELGSKDKPDFVLLHTINIADENLVATYKAQTQKTSINSKDPRIQKRIVKIDLAKIVSFYNEYILDLGGASVNNEPVTEGNKARAVNLLDAYYKRQVMACVVEALEEGLLD